MSSENENIDGNVYNKIIAKYRSDKNQYDTQLTRDLMTFIKLQKMCSDFDICFKKTESLKEEAIQMQKRLSNILEIIFNNEINMNNDRDNYTDLTETMGRDRDNTIALSSQITTDFSELINTFEREFNYSYDLDFEKKRVTYEKKRVVVSYSTPAVAFRETASPKPTATDSTTKKRKTPEIKKKNYDTYSKFTKDN